MHHVQLDLPVLQRVVLILLRVSLSLIRPTVAVQVQKEVGAASASIVAAVRRYSSSSNPKQWTKAVGWYSPSYFCVVESLSLPETWQQLYWN